jgi:hypothetical protein
MKNSTKVQLARYGVLALAGFSCESAKAGVVTSSSQGFIPFTIGAGQSVSVDFGSGIGSPFRFAGVDTFFTAPSASFVIQRGFAGANQQILTPDNDPNRLVLNYVISAGRPWANVGNGTENDIAGADGGKWNGSGTVAGFLGIRFQSSALTSGFHYGYFDVAYDNTPDSDSGKLTVRGWAYETDANTAITTPGATAPEPSSLLLSGLGMLSCGAAGLRSLRAQKKAKAESTASPLDA